MMDPTQLGENIRSKRVRARLSVRDLAYAARVGSTTVSNIENGVTLDPGVCTVLAIANALNVSIISLLEGK